VSEEETVPEPEIKVPCEVYSRIVGYIRPLSAWNDGKRQEFQDRLTFDLDATLNQAR
jgi:ribonucleoside-triphosphate reductase (formate)